MDLKAWTEAQRAVIGSLLLAPEECAGEVFLKTGPRSFGDAALRHVYEAARELWMQNRPLDPVTVLAAAGNDYAELLKSCMMTTPTAANVGAWLDLCRDAAKLSAMQAEALVIVNAENVTEAGEAFDRMAAAMQDSMSVKKKTLTELIGDYLDRMSDKRPVNYLHWGIEKLDSALYVGPGQFGILAADSSSGKTALALQFAYHMAADGRRVGFISLETPWESLEDRLMAEKQVAGVPLPKAKRKDLDAEDVRRVTEAGMRSDGMTLDLFRDCYTLPEIRAVILQSRLEVVFIDYVQLIDAPGTERWDIVTNISMGLHRMAQQLGVTVIGLSQITPAQKGSRKAPTKDDVRESRQLKQDADFILLLYPDQDDDAEANGRVLEIAKNKDGRLARLRLSFEPEYMTFTHRIPDVNGMRLQGKTVKGMKPTKPGELVPLEGGNEDIPF